MQHRPLVFIDIETTGGNPRFSRITEIGAVRVENGRVMRQYEQLLNPGCEVPPFITRLTGIGDEMLRGEPEFWMVADELKKLLSDAIFVAHHVNFDYNFIREEYQKIGQTFRMNRACTVRLDRLLYPNQKSHALDRIIERQGITVANRHRALDDATVLWEYFAHELAARKLDLFRYFEKTITKSPNNALDPHHTSSRDELPEMKI